jgi:nucleotide-binding universal stress UspA family protein
MNEFRVLLAVGPDGVRDGALDFAVDEAVARATGVELLHVMHSMVAVPSSAEQMEMIDRSMSKVGREVLTDAAARMRQRLEGRAPVSTQLLTGPVAPTIAHRASEVDVVVLERRDAGSIEQLLTLSVSTRVASQVSCPAVVVPRSWSAVGRDELSVTVGVDDPADPIGQVETAAAYAAARGRRLRVLNAAWVAEPYQSVALTGVSGQEWVQAARAELETSLDKLADSAAEIVADVRWARPGDALVAATRSSAVLVLNRRAAGHPFRAHLGGITRTVLHHAACPVMVVDRT